MDGQSMKELLKKIWSSLAGMNGLLLALYLVFALAAGAMISVPFSVFYVLFSLIFFVAVSLVAGPLLIRFFSKRNIRCEAPGKHTLLKISFYVLPLLIFLIYYAAWYPGGFSNDSIDQYAQVIDQSYRDWHPAIQTLLTFALPMALTGGWSGSIVLFQILVFSVVLGYLFSTVYQYTNTKYVVCTMVFLLMNPQLSFMALLPWKDVSFAIAVALLVTYSLRIYGTKGVWLRKPVNAVLFVVTAALATLFRHNGLLFTAPLLIALLFYMTKKQGLLICLSVIVLCGCIKIPLYSALGVQSPDKRQIETLGLPMSVISAAVVNDPEALDEDILEFAYQVAPRQVWEEAYRDRGYNSIKFHEQTNNDIIEEYGTQKVISMMLRCMKASKGETLKGLIHLTKPVYILTNDYDSFQYPGIAENELGLEPKVNSSLTAICEGYRDFVEQYLGYPYLHVGFIHLILIVAILAKCQLNKWRDWKKILLVLPVFVYNYGTTLLLTGTGDATRFFFYTYLLLPILLVFLFRENAERSSDTGVQTAI